MNKIKSLPSTIPRNMCTLNVARNMIAGDLSNLDYSSSTLAVVSFAANTSLTHLPSLGSLIYDLDISSTSVILDFKFPLLTRLRACSMNLETLPVLHAPLLSDFFLSGNALKKVDLTDSELPSLTQLYLDCNYDLEIVTLPASSKLGKIDLSYTSVTSCRLPASVKTLIAKDTRLAEKIGADELTTWKFLEKQTDEETHAFNRLHSDGGVLQFGPIQNLLLFRKRKWFIDKIEFLISQLRSILFGTPVEQISSKTVPVRNVVLIQRAWRRRKVKPAMHAKPAAAAPAQKLAFRIKPFKAQASVQAFLRFKN